MQRRDAACAGCAVHVFHLHGLERDQRLACRDGVALGGDGLLRASMNGRVVALLAAEGDTVSAGQPLVTLEAMKMEHVHCAPRAGRVAALHVAVGTQVAARHIVAEIAEA